MDYTFHTLDVYSLTNVGADACSIAGYPSVRYLVDGNTVNISTVESTDTPLFHGVSTSAVTLQPGEAAGVYVGKVGDPDSTGTCSPASAPVAALGVQGGEVVINQTELAVCSGDKLYVSPIHLGTAAPQPTS